MRDKFKLIINSADGQEYENLFVQTMSYFNSGFKSVKPHGNIGDRGNDGWVESSGEYYQVYAPDELFKNTDVAIKKIKDDFQKLKCYWDAISPIKSFFFVVNDKGKGVSPHISKCLNELKIAHNLDSVNVFTSSDLERILFGLSHEQICSILKVSCQQSISLHEDKKRVREFLDKLNFVFDELFQWGREAGYFFPASIFEFSESISKSSNDWFFQRLFSSETEIKDNQIRILTTLVDMYKVIESDQDYDHIGLSLKYKPPYELENRDELIEHKKDIIGNHIKDIASSYEKIRNYAT